MDMKESSQVVEIAEHFFLGLNAKIEMIPVMSPPGRPPERLVRCAVHYSAVRLIQEPSSGASDRISD